MAFVGGNSIYSGCNAGIDKIPVNIQATADRVNDFEHNTVLSFIFEETGIDWLLTEKRVVSLSKDKSTGYIAPHICAWKSSRYT